MKKGNKPVKNKVGAAAAAPDNPLITAIELQQQGKLAEAEALFRKILSVAPGNAAALYSLAVILLNSGRQTEALQHAAVGVEANADFGPLWFAHGAALQALHRYEEALASYDRALVINPRHLEVLVNSGALLRDMRRHHEALERFRRVIEIDPEYETALGNYGILLTELKEGTQAVAIFERLLRKNPAYPYGLGLLCYERMHQCDWTDLEATTRKITAGIRAGERVCKTLGYMALSDSSQDHLLCAEIFAQGQHPARPAPLWHGERYHHARTRLAYVSPDLREHPVGHLMAGVIEAHDKSRFETIAISVGIDDGSRIRARMIAAFDHFIDAKDMSPYQIAELMRQMEVDVAIDLAGYTSDARTEIFLHRPAPIQVNYLGYPGTMALDCYDYIIADRTVLPDEYRGSYSEKPAYLDHCYLPIASGIEVAEPQPRSAYGLPDEGFVFCAFSHDYKIHPRMFDVWMRLLGSNPGSVLWLVSRNETSQQNLRKAAQDRGIDPARLVFAMRVPRIEDHLARYRVADLFLDTWPYNAHTTAADALLAGLPVITYKGGSFPSRVAASLLETLGFDQLVTGSFDEYFELADGLVHDPGRLQALRESLTPQALHGHPFLGQSFTRSLEKVLDGMTVAEVEFVSGAEAAPPAPTVQAPEAPAVADSQSDALLNTALDLFRCGNLPQSELYARQCLARTPGLPAALGLLDDLRRGYGMADGFKLSERAPRDHREPRYLLIKAWGYGFWSEGHHMASQLLLAELTGRIPVVHWGENCLFRRDGDGEAFAHFFQTPSAVRLDDLPADASIYPPKWNRNNLRTENLNKWEGDGSRLAAQYLFNRPETIVVSDFFSTLSSILPWIGRSSRYYGMSEDAAYAALFQKYLKPVPRIAAMVDDFVARHMRGRPWAAVHVRGSDKIHESPRLAQTNANYFAFVDKIVELNPSIGVFLLTDAAPMIDEFRKRYGDRLLCTQAVRSNSNIGVHLAGNDGVAMGEEVLIDALLATKCDYFVGNQESNVSLAIASFKEWPKGFIFLLGEKSIRTENLFLHQRERDTKPKCRLCGSPAGVAFSQRVLFKHPVAYFKCQVCGSLQTETPYWLDEAYALKPERFDTGKASRTLANFLILPRLFGILGIRPADRCADFGGGTGLFARLMRDVGYNYHSFDKYGSGEFCDGFSWDHFDRPVKLVTIFECAEHFANPAEEWGAIFATGADHIVGTTGIYNGQGAEWTYLSPESGQHVFFYSLTGLAHLASKHGYSAYLLGSYFLISKAPLSEAAGAAIAEWNRNLGQASGDSFHNWLGNPFEHASRDNQRVASIARLRAAGVRIALDGTFFRFATGISRLWKSLLAEWSANGFGEFIVVIDRARTAPRFAGIAYVDAPLHNYADRQGDRRLLQDICDRERITLFTSTYYTTPLTTRAVLLVPDMIPEVMGFDLANEQWREKHDAIRYCRNYLSISNSTSADLRRFFPEIAAEQVVTAYCGTDFRTPAAERIQNFKERHGIDRPYFLISGVKSGYKNAQLFFDAFARLGDRRGEYAIVCTNSPPTLEPEFAACIGAAKVHLLILSDDDLQCAYAGAVSLVYPSRYEGFGLPMLEAMICSCPVITCNNSSIGEVAGDAAIYVDPDDVDDMFRALEAVQREDVCRDLLTKGRVQAAKFSWRKMADEVEAALSRWALPETPR